MKKSPYEKHLFKNYNDIINELKSGTCKQERKTMLKDLLMIIKKLKEDCIFTFPDISQTLKKCGMSSSNTKAFLQKFKVEYKHLGIKKRLIDKSNNSERNIIIAYIIICIDDSLKFVESLEKYYSNNTIKWKKNVDLGKMLQNDIIEIETQKRNHNISNEMVNQSLTTFNDILDGMENNSFSEFDEYSNNDEDDFLTQCYF